MVLPGKTAIVTGASRGIGRAIAVAMAQAGADVALNCLHPDQDALESERMVRDAGRRALLCYGDVADYPSVQSMIAETTREFGKIDIAIANAAFSERQPFYTADLDSFRRTIDVTMWGGFHLFRAAALQMIAQGQGGSMVAVSSPHAFTPYPDAMAYNMAKAAVDQMARTAAIELAEHRIRVNLLYPGWTNTPGEQKFNDESTLAKASAQLVWKRMARSEEIARAAVFLCDPASDYINGSSLIVDGAQSLSRSMAFESASPLMKSEGT